MKARKRILSILLSAFVFMAMHDFIIAHVDSDTQAELYMHKVENVPLCDASVLHELIHMTLMSVNQAPSCAPEITISKTWGYCTIDNAFSSLLKHRLYRPPIA